MSRHYSTNDFLRRVPARLLARYFRERGLLSDFDFTKLKDAKSDPLLMAVLALPDERRKPIDSDFSDVFEMSCEAGFKAILSEVPFQLKTTPEEIPAFTTALSSLSSHYERAMVTFLDYPALWTVARRFYEADSLTAHWRKRKNLPHKAAAVDRISLAKLEAAIAAYFHSEGRGKHCVVEPYRRGELDYFFAFPEDYSQQAPEWVDGVFKQRPHTPAFPVIFIYSQSDGTLDINFRGTKKSIPALQTMFADVVLGLNELPPDPKDERVYELGPILQRSFEFRPDLGSGIESVVVSSIRLSSRIKKGDRITLEADTSRDPKAIYGLLDKIGKSVPLHLYNVTRVELSASVAIDGKDTKHVAIRIAHPNTCSLKYDELGNRLRDMLTASGIELKNPQLETEMVLEA